MRWLAYISAGVLGFLIVERATVVAQESAPKIGVPQPVAVTVDGPAVVPQAAPVPVADGATPVAAVPVAETGHHHFGYLDGPVDWSKIPAVRKMDRIGFFPVPPKGEGYYSILDALTGNWRAAPPKSAYPPSAAIAFPFFDADFRYLDDPKNTQHDPFDCLHRIHIGDDFMFSTGGEVRLRYMNEVNSRLTGKDNTYDLFRTRIYGDLSYRDSVRVFVEYIDADSLYQDLAPLPIDINRGDLLNAFVEFTLPNLCDEGRNSVRIGRQELLLGSQRLVSPLDWANTRRTFNGVRASHTSADFDADLFWAQPVIPNASRFDSVDNNQNFAGLFTTYRPQKQQLVDFYYLFEDNANATTQSGIVRNPQNVHTIGSRYLGDKNHYLWEVEGAVQFGDRGPEDIFAGMFTAGVGYNWECAPMSPTAWLYYDYASGDRTPNTGDFNTFNQLFPFGHYYLGWTDLVGRQNINDLQGHLYLYPTKWCTLWFQLHHFWLDSSKDGLYNAAGNIIRRSPTGAAGNDVGNELDIITNFHVGPHSDIMVGYCHLFAGDFIQATAPAGVGGGDSNLFFAMYTFRW